MWVQGDLKDELGLSHRKAKKGRKKERSLSALEAAPMFDKDHNRSISDYEPAMTSSPGTSPPSESQAYLDTPPLGAEEMLTPAQYAYAKARDADLMPPSALGAVDAPSRASYYSVSEIPPPSPLPSPKYKYSDGTITSTPPSRRSSIATMRTIPQTPNVPLPQPRSPNLMLPGVGELTKRLGASHTSPTNPGSFEMRVRSPPLGSPGSSDLSHAQTRSASAASYATANEDAFVTADGGELSPHQQQQGFAHQQTLAPYNSYNQGDNVDTQTVRQSQYSQYSQFDGDRRASAVSAYSEVSWQGGMAM